MDEFTAHCLELLSPLGAVRARRMFGGQGIYADELFIALILGETLYLKVSAESRPRFEAAGCEPFRYERQGATASLGFYRPPEEAMESPALMQPWARLALQAALQARNAKNTVKRSPSPKKPASPRKPRPSS
jgi:DNA transformation protein